MKYETNAIMHINKNNTISRIPIIITVRSSELKTSDFLFSTVPVGVIDKLELSASVDVIKRVGSDGAVEIVVDVNDKFGIVA